MNRAELVAPNVKLFMNNALRSCRNMKDQYISYAWNYGLAFTLILSFALILYFRYRGKPSKEELEAKRREEHQYIMQQLGNHVATRQFEQKQSQNVGELTGLPGWANNPEVAILNSKII